ncbi:MAG: hypothetical protein Q8O04_12580 [Deltaproteobacteria bacterium]|nr:hypothetical protein [Deltaproteobacteria bacterium]
MPIEYTHLFTKIVASVIFLIFTSSICYAKAVKVEEIITEAGEWQGNISLSYTNIHKKEGKTSSSLIELPGGIITSIPFFIGEEKVNEDLLSYSFMLKRGLTKGLELYSFVNLFSDFRRITLNNQTNSEDTHKFDLFGVGASYQILKEDKYPALIASLSAHALDNERFTTGYNMNYFKTYSIGLISYYTVDPVVFLLQGRYQLNLKRTKGTESINPAEIFSLSPQIYFAVNPYTTINWGLKWTIQGKSSINEEITSATTTDVSYLFGFGYELKKDQTMSMDVEFKNTSDLTQSTVGLKLTWRF